MKAILFPPTVAAFGLENGAKQFSYLPLAHIAERQIVEVSSLMHCGEVHFNESLEFLLRDLQRCRPNMVFGPPQYGSNFNRA